MIPDKVQLKKKTLNGTFENIITINHLQMNHYPYLPSFGLNSTTKDLLQGWLCSLNYPQRLIYYKTKKPHQTKPIPE